MKKIQTAFTNIMKIQYPIIAAPMFLVSNTDIVVATSEAGGLGTFPALNYRTSDAYANALKEIKSRTRKPIGVNVIVNKSNVRQDQDLKLALDHGVEMFITSLGNPKKVIEDAHKNGAKVFCDVTNLDHALKVQELGADGVIAVCTGAGGHAGPITPFVLIPLLREKLGIPVIAAGGISHGSAMAAAIVLGASGISVGTRFIASKEAKVDDAYKQAIIDANAEDIVMTSRISGTPAAVIETEYVKKIGRDLPYLVQLMKDYPLTKKYVVPLIHMAGTKKLEESIRQPSWKSVWSAGQSVGLVEQVLTCEQIVQRFIIEYEFAVRTLPV